jgi:DNA-binding beta-propeller fold protein YncE
MVGLAVLLLFAPLAWALGELSQKPGTAGCISETGTAGACRDGKALEGAEGVAASADGKSVYVTSGVSDGVAVFDRDPATGALTQKAGPAGCISEDGTGGLCQNGAALDGAVAVAASGDGKSVYVAAALSNSVAVFNRDPATGALTQKAGTAGCVSETGTGGACQDGNALKGAFSVSPSPDGRSVYVASLASGAVAVLDRDPATGALTQKAGTAGCVSDDGTGGACQDGTELKGAFSVSPSPDGRSVYVASQISGAVAVFDRDPATAALTQKAGTAGCVSDDGTGGACQDGTALVGAFSVAAGPDGKSVYVASATLDAVAVFDRDPATGALTQKPGTAGCVSETGTGGDCQDGTALDSAVAVAASPDGKSVYVASADSDAVAVFDRDATGALAQKPGLACVSESGTGACQDGTALDGAIGVTVSPDGTSLYAASAFSNSVAIFDRATPSPPASPPPPAPAPPDTLAPTVTGFRLTPARFRVASAGTPTDAHAAARRRRAPRGSRLRFTLSERARARILIERALPGRRVGGRCRPATRRLRRRPSCSRHKLVGSLSRHNLPAGPNTVRFSGRIGRRALARGRYRATITATDPADNHSAPSRAGFAIARG